MKLDETSTKILIFIRDNSPARMDAITEFVSDKSTAERCVTSLRSKKFIEGLNYNTYHTPNGVVSVSCSPYVITPDGVAYLENDKKQARKDKWENFHKWANTIIALLALLTAIPALALTVKQLLK